MTSIETERLILTGDPLHDAPLIERAGAVIRAGGLVAFPTETVYGLGADALNPDAVRRIFEAKGRPAWDPLIVHAADLEQLRLLVQELPPTAERLAQKLMPGPLTLVLPKASRVPDIVTAGRPTVAVRIPAHPVAQALIRASGTPIAAPSANRFGRPSPTNADHVMADLAGRIELVLDAGPTPVGVESTVINLTTHPPTILRPGGVARETIEQLIGRVRLLEEAMPEGQPLPSPGTSPRHYAPRVPLLLCPPEPEAFASAVEDALNLYMRIGAMAPEGWRLPTDRRVLVYAWGHWGDWQGLAQRLFEGIRWLEAQGVDAIVCPLPPAEQLALAIRDRLLRAAHPPTPNGENPQ
jgi:L-threonylcarbamoyladenylate synthase